MANGGASGDRSCDQNEWSNVNVVSAPVDGCVMVVLASLMRTHEVDASASSRGLNGRHRTATRTRFPSDASSSVSAEAMVGDELTSHLPSPDTRTRRRRGGRSARAAGRRLLRREECWMKMNPRSLFPKTK